MDTSSAVPPAVPQATREVSQDTAMLSTPKGRATTSGSCSDRGLGSSRSYLYSDPS